MENLQPLILESLQLLLIGMGTVFVILVMLIFLITLVSKWVSTMPEEQVHDGVRRPGSVHLTNLPDTQQEVVAVISAAISSYRKRHANK